MKQKTLSRSEIAQICQELSLLLRANIRDADALTLLAEETGEKELKRAFSEAAERCDMGTSLAQSLRQSELFPSYVWGLLDVGERSGRTEEALEALESYYESQARMERQIRSALLYPAVMLCLMLAVIGVLLVKVLPVFNDVYASLGAQLTGMAGGLLALGRGIDAMMPVLCAALCAVAVLVVAFAGVPAFREWLLGRWRAAWGDKGISRQLNSAKIVQAIAMGMTSGLPPEEAVTLAADMMESNEAAKARCLDCRAALDKGGALGEVLKGNGLLDAGQARLLELSRQSGATDATMSKLAVQMMEDSHQALEDRVNRVEPALVLVCALLVGLILLSVMLPLMHIMSAIG